MVVEVVVVEMTQSCGGYNAGETAGFTPERAAFLISKGKAKPIEQKEDKPEPKKVVAAVMQSPVKK